MNEIHNIEDWNYLLNKHNKTEDDFLQIAQSYEIGLTFDNSLKINQNYEKAFEWYLKGSVYDYCKIRVADFLSEGLGCEKDLQKSIQLYNELISKNNSVAAFNLSTIYRDNNDYNKSFGLLNKIYEIDNLYPIELAFYFLYGIGTQINKEKSKEIFLKIKENSKNYSEYEIEQANYQLAIFHIEKSEIQNARNLLLENDNEYSNDLLNIIGR